MPTFPDDIWFIFDVKNTLPNAWNLALNYQSSIIPSLFSVFRHLEYLLAYASTPSILSLVQYAWSQLDILGQIYQQASKKIYLDPRFEQTRHGIRPIACVTLLLTDATHILATLWSCHLLLQYYGLNNTLLDESRSRLFNSLGSLADDLELLSVGFRFDKDEYTIADQDVCRYTRRTDSNFTLPAFILWRRFATAPMTFCQHGRDLIPQAEISKSVLSSLSTAAEARFRVFTLARMIEGLRFISYGMPDACRLIQILEGQATSGIT